MASVEKKGRKKASFITLENPDKANHEHWDERRSLANIPRPYRSVCIGPPNSGKTTCILNLIAHARPPFSRIIVCSVDPEAREWTGLCEGCEVYEEIPDFKEIDGESHIMVILEDLALTTLKGEQAEKLDRLFGHGSSHRNISVVATAQDLFKLPTCVRRQANVFNLWPCPDVSSIQTIAERVGLKRGELLDLFRELCKRKHDFITLDLTDQSPSPVRFNLIKGVDLVD